MLNCWYVKKQEPSRALPPCIVNTSRRACESIKNSTAEQIQVVSTQQVISTQTNIAVEQITVSTRAEHSAGEAQMRSPPRAILDNTNPISAWAESSYRYNPISAARNSLCRQIKSKPLKPIHAFFRQFLLQNQPLIDFQIRSRGRYSLERCFCS